MKWSGLMNEKQFKIYATISMVLILIFIFNVYSSRRKIEQMERSISYIRAQTNNMENEFRNSIYQLENRLKEANADIVTYQFTYGDLNASKETIRLHMVFDLREVVANAKYYVCYSPLVEENYTEVEANSTGDTSFDCILDLSIKNNYKFKIIEKTKDGGIRQLKHDNIVSFIYDDFFVRRTYIQSYGRSIDNERILLDFNVTNNTFGIEDYEIEKVELILSLSDIEETVVYREDITDNKDRDLVYSKVPGGSRGSRSSFSMSETAAQEETSLSTYDYIKEEYYYVAISKKQLEEAFPGIVQGDLLEILHHRLMITYKNGDQQELY